jgi:hypothetical protein
MLCQIYKNQIHKSARQEKHRNMQLTNGTMRKGVAQRRLRQSVPIFTSINVANLDTTSTIGLGCVCQNLRSATTPSQNFACPTCI